MNVLFCPKILDFRGKNTTFVGWLRPLVLLICIKAHMSMQAMVEWLWQKETEWPGRKPAPIPLHPPQIAELFCLAYLAGPNKERHEIRKLFVAVANIRSVAGAVGALCRCGGRCNCGLHFKPVFKLVMNGPNFFIFTFFAVWMLVHL